MNRIELQSDRLFQQAMANVHKRLVSEYGSDEELLEEMQENLEEAAIAFRPLYKPAAVYIPLECRHTIEGVLLPNGQIIGNQKLNSDIDSGSDVLCYLNTTGHCTDRIFQDFQMDYTLYHFHHYLAREVTLLQGKEIHRVICQQSPDYKYLRYAISPGNDSGSLNFTGDKAYIFQSWAPDIVSSMLEFFPDQLGIAVTDSGCFNPLYTLLGITVGSPKVQSRMSEVNWLPSSNPTIHLPKPQLSQ